MLSANVIESVPMLENLLNTTGNPVTAEASYLVATFNYKKDLQVGHTYWYAYAYKYSNIQNSSLSSDAPTWVGFWYDHGASGSATGTFDLNTPVAGKDYYLSNSFTVTPEYRPDRKFSYCSIYHGSRDHTYNKAVRGQVWNAVLYDITEWKIGYAGKGNATPEQALYDIWKSRCTGAGSDYTDKISYNVGGNQTKLFVKSDAVGPIELIEYEGLDIYQAQSTFGKLDPFLHNSTLRPYNYSNVLTGGTLTINNGPSNIDPESPLYPDKSKSVTKITVKGATARSDGKLGGFVYPWKMGEVSSGVVVEKLVAKVPVGYSLQPADNWPTATKNSQKCKITATHSTAGTGKYEEYTWIYEWNNCSKSDLPWSNTNETINKTGSFTAASFPTGILIKEHLQAGYTISDRSFTTTSSTEPEPLLNGCLVVFKAGTAETDIIDRLRESYSRGDVLKVVSFDSIETYTTSEETDIVFYNLNGAYLDDWLKSYPNEMYPPNEYAEYTSSGTFTFSFKLSYNGPSNYWAGYIYLKADSSTVSKTDVTWYVAYYNNIALKDGNIDVSKYKYYTILPGKDVIGGDKIFTNSVDSQNIFANGDFSDINMPLPSNYAYTSDQTILNGVARTAIYQKAGASASWTTVGPLMKINPLSKYKFSCDIYTTNYTGDFYTALIYYRYADKSDGGYNATNTWYRAGTRTTLAKDLNPGDTVVYLSSVSNWSVMQYSNISVRYLTSDRHERTLWNFSQSGVISTIDLTTNTLTLNTAYAGTNKVAAGTTVVESCIGSTYYYPVLQSTSIKKFGTNGWHHFEVTFGTDGNMWDGGDASWVDIPMNAKYVAWCPNGAANTSGNPVYFANVRIEDIGVNSGEKQEGKVQLKRFFNNLDYGIGINHCAVIAAFDPTIIELTINGTKLSSERNSIMVEKGTTVTISHRILASDYQQDSSGYFKYTGISISSNYTFSGTSFTMPAFAVNLTITPTKNYYYKVGIQSESNTTLLIGFDANNLSHADLYLLQGTAKTVYYKFNDSHTQHYLDVYYGNSFQKQYYRSSGYFSANASGHTFLKASAETPVYNYYQLTVTNLNDSKFRLVCNDMRITSEGMNIRENSTVKLNFTGVEYQSSGVYYKYMLTDYSPTQYSTGLFTMPSEDVSITVNYEARQEYNITTSATGCSISVTSRAALGENVSYRILYDGSNNRDSVVISWSGYECKTTGSGSFTMPAEDVTITAKAWEYTEPTPSVPLSADRIDGICVYSVSNTVGHRNFATEKSTIDTHCDWAGTFDELNTYKDNNDITSDIEAHRADMFGYFSQMMSNIAAAADETPITLQSISIGSRIVHVIFSIDNQLFSSDDFYVFIQPNSYDVDNSQYVCIDEGSAQVYGNFNSDLNYSGGALALCTAYSNQSDFVLIDYLYTGWTDFEDLTQCCLRLAILTGEKEDAYESNFFIDFDYCMANQAQHTGYPYYTHLLPNFGSGLEFNLTKDDVRYFVPLGSYCGFSSDFPSHIDGNIMCFNPDLSDAEYQIHLNDSTSPIYILAAIVKDFDSNNGYAEPVGGFTSAGFQEGETELMDLGIFQTIYPDFISVNGNDIVINPDGLINYCDQTQVESLFTFDDQLECLYISLIQNGDLHVILSRKTWMSEDLDINQVSSMSPRYSYFGDPDSEFVDASSVEVNGNNYTGKSLVIMN